MAIGAPTPYVSGMVMSRLRDLRDRVTGNPTPIVPVVRLSGAIGAAGRFRGGGLSLAGMAGPLERAFKLRGARAVALSISSPGGSAVQSALISQRIRTLSAEHKLPVVAFVEDVAASGGYWLACSADEIFAQETSIVGSIGVVAGGFGFTGLIERLGVERRLHTAGDRKAQLDPFRPEDPVEVARLKKLLDEIHDSFRAMVQDRRGDRLRAGEEDLFSGEFWTGRRALELGLIDGFGEIRGVMRARYGDKVKLRAVGTKQSFLRRITRGSDIPLSAPRWDASSVAADVAGELIATIEDRLLWSRYGL